MITSGGSFMFIKLVKGLPPRYATSDILTSAIGNELYNVLSILKHLSQLSEGEGYCQVKRLE